MAKNSVSRIASDYASEAEELERLEAAMERAQRRSRGFRDRGRPADPVLAADLLFRVPAARHGRLMAINERAILKSELRWAAVVSGIVAIILGAILFAALSMHINPPSNREYVDPKTLHLSAEFTERISARASIRTAASSRG